MNTAEGEQGNVVQDSSREEIDARYQQRLLSASDYLRREVERRSGAYVVHSASFCLASTLHDIADYYGSCRYTRTLAFYTCGVPCKVVMLFALKGACVGGLAYLLRAESWDSAVDLAPSGWAVWAAHALNVRPDRDLDARLRAVARYSVPPIGAV